MVLQLLDDDLETKVVDEVADRNVNGRNTNSFECLISLSNVLKGLVVFDQGVVEVGGIALNNIVNVYDPNQLLMNLTKPPIEPVRNGYGNGHQRFLTDLLKDNLNTISLVDLNDAYGTVSLVAALYRSWELGAEVASQQGDNWSINLGRQNNE